MRRYDKSILRLLDACERFVCCSEANPLLLVYSDNKKELIYLCDALCRTVESGLLITRNEIATYLVEILLDESKQSVLQQSKSADLLFITDFEVMAKKERSQKIIYRLLKYRLGEGKRTIVFSNKNVFDGKSYSNQIEKMFESSDKYEI